MLLLKNLTATCTVSHFFSGSPSIIATNVFESGPCLRKQVFPHLAGSMSCPPHLPEAPVIACFSCCSLHSYFCQVRQLRPLKQICLKEIIFSRITRMSPQLVSQHSWLFWELSSGHSQCQVQQFISRTLYWKPFTRCSWYTSGMHFPKWEWPRLQMWPGQQCRLQTQNDEWLKLEKKYSCASTAQQYLP